jgi:hypothetical protein
MGHFLMNYLPLLKADGRFAQNGGESEKDRSGGLRFGPETVVTRNWVGDYKVESDMNATVVKR